MKGIELICILSLSMLAMIMDIRRGRIPNILISTGLGLGFGYRLFTQGALGFILFLGGIVIPLLFLWILYYFRMLGAGDIKLFCVLGGFLQLESFVWCIVISFLVGAGISMFLLLKHHNLWSRLSYFYAYISDYSKNKVWVPYRREQDAHSQIHFTIPILISVLLYTGGFY